MIELRIPLDITQDEPHKGLISTVALVRGPYRIFGSVKFFIDTGSSISFISEGDAKRMNIPFKILEFKDRTAVGGVPIMLAEIKSITFSFKTEEGFLPITSQKIYVSRILSTKAEVPYYPSIIGVNFLEINKLRLVYSPFEKIAFLEKI